METGLAPGCAEVLVWLYMLGGRLRVLHRAGARVMASAAFLGAGWIGVVLAGAAVRGAAVMAPAVVLGEAGIRREAVQHSVSTWGFAQMLESFPNGEAGPRDSRTFQQVATAVGCAHTLGA